MPHVSRSPVAYSRRARLLIVDDEPANVRLLERILERAGYGDLVATSEAETVPTLFAAARPDLVLLDLHMPPVCGFALLERLAGGDAAGVFLPVVVLTADSSREARERALRAGASDFLLKPFDPVEVVLRIANLLEMRHLHLRLGEENRRLEERVRLRTAELQRAQDEVLERLARAAEMRDDETGQHTRRVGERAAVLGAALGLPPATVELLRHTAPLHDVGKIAIPDAILRKPGPLAAAERKAMERHTLLGASILSGGGSAAMRMAEEIALGHHERWDGAGYPLRLAGEEIPLAARIVAVADVYDALAHDRPYRAAVPPAEALRHIAAGAGSHFDPRVAAAMLESVGSRTGESITPLEAGGLASRAGPP
jgi:putative two-component system response regulator